MRIFRLIRQGTSHREQKIVCQDAADYKILSEDSFVLALSDGAGQAKYARQAAWANVNAILELFSRMPLEEFVRLPEEEQKKIILFQCRSEIQKLSEDLKCRDMREFSATLLFVAVDKKRFLAGHIGDGAIYMTDTRHKVCFASDPENGETSRHTFFTVGSNAEEHLHLESLERKPCGPAMILLMSDGPHMMFKDRGFGQGEQTAEEISSFILEGKVEDDEELELLLDQMTELEIEKMDDWSVLAVSLLEEALPAAEPIPKGAPKNQEYEDENTVFVDISNRRLPVEKLLEKDIIEALVNQLDASGQIGSRTEYRNISAEYTVRTGGRVFTLEVISVSAVLSKYWHDQRALPEAYEEAVKYIRKQIQILNMLKGCSSVVPLQKALEIRRTDTGRTEWFFLFRPRLVYAKRVAAFPNWMWNSYTWVKQYNQCLDDLPRFDDLQIMRVARSMLKALTELEKQGILHGNINPWTILVKGNEEERQYLLGGFGQAGFARSGPVSVRRGQMTKFSAPEIWNEGCIRGFESDIFSLGSVLFYLMSSRRSVPLDYYRRKQQPRLGHGSDILKKIILKAAAYDPRNRYASASDMLKDLERIF